MKIESKKLQEYAKDMFRKAGTTEEEAATVAEELVTSNLMGLDSHGVLRIPQYLDQIKEGLIIPGSEVRIVKETSTTAIVDGNHAFGQMVGHKMATLLITKAKTSGVACAISINTPHVGRVGSYTEQIANAGLLAFSTVGLYYNKPLAPWGAMESRMGTNPISWAGPRKGECPVFMDGAMTVVAEGKIRTYVQRGEPVPHGWIRDGYGKDTTDPMALYREPAGTIYPVGGPNAGGVKGSGLAVMANMFSIALADDDYWTGLAKGEKQHAENGVFMMAIDPDAFCGRDAYAAQVKNHSDYIKSARPAEGFKEVLMPGEFEHRNADRLLQEGIELPDDTWNGIVSIAKNLGCDWAEAYEVGEIKSRFVRY